MIDNGTPQKIRLEKLNQTARRELEVLVNDKNIFLIKELDKKNNKLIKIK